MEKEAMNSSAETVADTYDISDEGYRGRNFYRIRRIGNTALAEEYRAEEKGYGKERKRQG
ncbi:MAG: hypothetical protein V8R80_12120 [Eubacterium sp.]